MTRFTEHLERNLDQIGEQITPSSTAWETIQHRIAEQTTEPTMEVIMLNPDAREPNPTVSRTALALAAALIVVVGAAAVFLLPDGSDELDTIDEPEVTVPLELDSEEQPEVIVPDPTTPNDAETGADSEDAADAGGEASTEDPAEPLVMSGDVIADCDFSGELVPDPDDPNEKSPQSCVFRDTSVVPFAVEQDFVLTTYRDTVFHDPSSGPFVPITGVADSGTTLSPSGFMYAGYLWEGQPFVNGRFVGVADGAGPYEGMLIHVSGRSFSADDGVVHMQWVAGDDLTPLTLSGTDATPEEMSIDCAIVGVDEDVTNDGDPKTELYTTSCTASGNDSSLLPAPSTYESHLFGNGLFVPTVGDYQYIVTPGSNLVAGVISPEGRLLSVGVSSGEGALEGMLIHDLWVPANDSADGLTGTFLRRWALPPAE